MKVELMAEMLRRFVEEVDGTPRILLRVADTLEAQQKKIDQLMADLMASVDGKLGGTFTQAEAFKLIEYYKGRKCTMCKHFGGVKGKHLTEKLPEDHGENCWKCHCNFEWVPPEERKGE